MYQRQYPFHLQHLLQTTSDLTLEFKNNTWGILDRFICLENEIKHLKKAPILNEKVRIWIA